MQTRISSKGQVVLPGPIRRKLGLGPGDALDTVTRLPVLSAGPRAARLTSEQVQDILSNLP
jgi:AbrB family looped-hinge helix DNA binding protein